MRMQVVEVEDVARARARDEEEEQPSQHRAATEFELHGMAEQTCRQRGVARKFVVW